MITSGLRVFEFSWVVSVLVSSVAIITSSFFSFFFLAKARVPLARSDEL
jgi:hypothetical protein